jgi:CHAT domain-containing protein
LIQEQIEVLKQVKGQLEEVEARTGTDMGRIKVLFLAANPADTLPLRLEAEAQAIESALAQAEYRDRFEVKQHWAVRATDIQSAFLRHEPDIVHFSGHGSKSNAIILEDDSGRSHPVSARALSRLFSVLKGNIRCVILNACYTQAQAEEIAEHIDCVVGMSKALGDSAAISFATAFYQALGVECTHILTFVASCQCQRT